DEYQDTNHAQFVLTSLLSGGYNNLMVVGDDDQSIYKFRGANIRNILDFEIEFPEAVTIKLEQNYRSTKNILNAANAVIANNKERKGKNLWTDTDGGDKITLFTAANEHEEALYIAGRIEECIKGGGAYSDCAVLYRINAQSRVLEEMFMRMNIPYRVLAGLRFYDRKEIKDIIAYLRVIYNSGDDVSLRRIVNEPKRGIGQTTVDKAQKIADENEIPLFSVFEKASSYPELKRAAANIKSFVEMIHSLSALKNSIPLSELVSRTMSDTGYSLMVKTIADNEGSSRAENLSELLSVVKEYEESPEEESTLGNFLERVALVSDVDNYDESQDSVVLMTIHSAKGLEFPIVFLPGMENGLFPGSMSIGDREEMEEERRLCYVAITRAKKKLYITKAEARMIFGKTVYQPQSVFIGEIPSDCFESHTAVGARISAAFRSFGFEAPKPKQTDWRKTEVKHSDEKFIPGDLVTHPKFGQGKVISAQVFGDDCKVEVVFDSFGKKILMSNFAKLKKL
ncbi:MAG: UvrD-helicase domain-containing protein, partial [Clostridia bacterium]|nr:UvrD-helicase domain-containing protein [Clostridia bacterium]